MLFIWGERRLSRGNWAKRLRREEEGGSRRSYLKIVLRGRGEKVEKSTFL